MNRLLFIFTIIIVIGLIHPTSVGSSSFKKHDIAVTDLVVRNNGRTVMVDDWTLITCKWSRTNNMAFKVQIWIDGRSVHKESIPKSNHRAGEVTYRWKALAGEHTISAHVFPSMPHLEKPEGNNRKIIRIIVATPWPVASNAQLPDLVPLSLTWKALDNQNQTINLEVTVKNQGPKRYDGRKCNVEITVQNPRNPNQKSTAWASLETPLAPGQTTVVKQEYRNMVGEHSVFIHVDSRNTVRELREDNNKLELRNFIIPAVWPSPRK